MSLRWLNKSKLSSSENTLVIDDVTSKFSIKSRYLKKLGQSEFPTRGKL
jgi:hypothetical protein